MPVPHSEQVANVLKELIGVATESIAFVNGHAYCFARHSQVTQFPSLSTIDTYLNNRSSP